jgi:AcrR family transcriptional regulator
MTASAMKQERARKCARAAAQLFARQGYHGTSTREIARLAGISENTLFRHFESKENLFWTALRSGLAGWEISPDLLEDLQANRGPEVVLPRLVAQVIDTTILNPELLRLIAVASMEMRGKATTVCGEYLSPILATINRYLGANIELGRLRILDPSLLTAAIVTTALMYPVVSEFINGDTAPPSKNRDTIRALSRFWIDALAPATHVHQQA